MKSTTDIWFASYLLLQGEVVEDFTKTGPRKARYEFKLDEEKWKEYKLQFFSSEIQQIKLRQEQLKDLLY